MNDKRHTYEYDVDAASQTAPANVVRMVGNNKRVLEIGCGPGSITKILAQQGGCKVTGLELDPEAIKKVTQYCEQVLQADLNSSEWTQLLEDMEKFDVVVAADVLEHLYDPWKALPRMASLLNSDGYIVISLPHVGHAAVMACMINGDFEYRDWGLLDRTHIRFFGLKNIEALFAQANLKIIEATCVTKPPEETEFAAVWSKLPAGLQDTLMSSSPHSAVYQVVVKAIPLDRSGNTVPLIPPKYQYRRQVIPSAESLKARMGQMLGAAGKQRVRHILGLLGIKI